MEILIEYLKKALAGLLALLGIEVSDAVTDNIESAIKDVVDFGKDAAAE